MVKIKDAAQYIIDQARAGALDLSHLKLQKLLYYCQAWHLAFYRDALFEEKFQAWIHGPVSRGIYDMLNDKCMMFDSIPSDITLGNSGDLGQSVIEHIDSVLEAYAKFSGAQLEILTHGEAPWINARGSLPVFARCENIISEDDMRDFYGAKIK